MLKFPHRIIHSHNSRVESGKEGKPLTTARQRIKQNATHRFACSHDAGDFLFGKDAVDSGQVSVLINTINAKKYVYNEANRTAMRHQLKIDDDIVAIGSVARFEEQKNHTFMLQVMEELQKHGNKWTLILIGEGTLLEQTKAEATLRNVADQVRFIDATGEIPRYLSAFDLLLIPSLHEGIPLAIIEAQAASLPSLASKGRIPEAAACTDIVHFLPLEEGPKAWAAQIAKFTPSERSDGQLPPGNWDAGYDVNSSAPKLTAMYEAMVS